MKQRIIDCILGFLLGNLLLGAGMFTWTQIAFNSDGSTFRMGWVKGKEVDARQFAQLDADMKQGAIDELHARNPNRPGSRAWHDWNSAHQDG